MRYLKLLLLFVFLVVTSAHGATVTRYIDTDVSGGTGDGTSWANAYNSCASWESAEQTDLVAAGDIHEVYARGATDDTGQCYISGWTTGAANYIYFKGDATTGQWGDSKYTVNLADQEYGSVRIRDEFVRLDHLQIDGVATGSSKNYRVYIGELSGDSDIRISNSYIRGRGTTTAVHQGISVNDTDANVRIWNSIIANFPTTASISYAIYFLGENGYFWNNIITSGGEYYGIRSSSSTIGVTEIVNCAIFNNSTDDIMNIDIVANTATDQGAGEGTSGVDISATWNITAFTSEVAGDYSIESDSPLVDQGQTDPGGVIQENTDIAGGARSGTWDIGAFEFVVEAATGRLILISGD